MVIELKFFVNNMIVLKGINSYKLLIELKLHSNMGVKLLQIVQSACLYAKMFE
jgi:hypothetical protein